MGASPTTCCTPCLRTFDWHRPHTRQAPQIKGAPLPATLKPRIVSLLLSKWWPTKRPRYGNQMREHDSAPGGKESGHTTNAKEEEIFSDMS